MDRNLDNFNYTTQEGRTLTVYPWAFLFVVKVVQNRSNRLGIIWYKVSDYKGRILDYMKLSLDANLLPVTHAAGGGADIVYEYEATKDYPAHTLLLEATLAESTNQRRLEMEPVPRHLGNHILKTNNRNSYSLFATTYLDMNVISDFRGRKHMAFYDTKDENHYIIGMKIIPIQTTILPPPKTTSCPQNLLLLPTVNIGKGREHGHHLSLTLDDLRGMAEFGLDIKRF